MMNDKTESLNPQVLDAVSIFLCPLKVGREEINKLEKHWQEKSFQYQKEKSDSNEAINTYAFPDLTKEIYFGIKGLKYFIKPSVALAGGTDWVVLALKVTFYNLPIHFDDLLLFNVGFRRTQGNPEQQDSFFDTDINELKLTNGTNASSIYEEFASELFTQYTYLPKLTKAIILSYAKFDSSLSDNDLYRYGTIAYANEPASPHWTVRLNDHVFDRWSSSGWRCFVHSYSLVYALAAGLSESQYQSIKESFLKDYFKIGVAITVQRAWLQEFLSKIKNVFGLDKIRKYHDKLIRIQSHLGATWTSEGTQRMQIEQMWRQTSGVNDRMSEAILLLEQNVAFEEAKETEKLARETTKLNTLISLLSGIVST